MGLNIGAAFIIALGIGLIWIGFRGSYANVWTFVTGNPIPSAGVGPGAGTPTTETPVTKTTGLALTAHKAGA